MRKTMKTFRFICASASACLLAACAPKGRVPVDRLPEKAAQRGLEGFRKAMTDTVAQVLGFRNAEEGRRSRLGQPVRVFEPGCEAILGVNDTAQSIDPRSDSGTMKYYYPILGDADRKVSLVLVARLTGKEKYGAAGEWSAVQVGSKSLMGKLDAVMGKQPDSRKPSLFLVQSYAVGAAFLGYEANGDIRLIPVVLSDSAAGCFAASRRGDELRTAEAFYTLGRCFDKAQVCRQFDEKDLKGWGLENAHRDNR
jgi:hypothetical protein